jgi:Flp pilus assembly protein TadG
MTPPRSRRRGVLIVELAFLLPLLLALFMVIADLGYLFYTLISMHTAVRQGVYAGIHDTVWSEADIETITFRADQGRSFLQSEVNATLVASDPSFGNNPTCEVTINHAHRFLVPFALPWIMQTRNTITLTARAKAIVVRGLKLR